MFQFPAFATLPLCIQGKLPIHDTWKSQRPSGKACRRSDFPSTLGGFPHSEIHGSKGIRTSPWLIAAYHVLHRLCMPRHTPIALKTLDCSHCQCPSGDGTGNKKTSFSRSVRWLRLGKANHVPEIERFRRRTTASHEWERVDPVQIYSLRCRTEQASDRSPLQIFTCE